MLDINVILAVLLMAGGTNANDELIVVLASPDISDEVSSAKLTYSATRVSISTGSFTICLRFKLRMVPEFGYYARLGEEIEDGDHRKGELFSWYIGRPRNTWVIGFSDLAYGFLSDSKRTQDIAPNKWNHLCIAISLEARMVRPILVSASKN